MNLRPSIIHGFREIWANKMRSFLSMSGVILGVAALISMIAIVHALTANSKHLFEEEGGIEKFEIQERPAPEYQEEIAGRSKGLTYDDYQTIKATCPLIQYVEPKAFFQWRKLRYKKKKTWQPLWGATPNWAFVQRIEMDRGRMISDLDVDSRARVCVLGSRIAENLFGADEDPLGKKIKCEDELYTVIGVFKHYRLMQGSDNALWWKNYPFVIPITTAMQIYEPDEKLEALYACVRDVQDIKGATEQVENVLLVTHRGIEDFMIQTQAEQLEALRKMQRSFTYGLGGIALISIFVGGIGIMNVMLASISERIREIGIRKAIGARNRDIFMQFLIESSVVSFMGGILGIILSGFLIFFIGFILEEYRDYIAVPPYAIVLSFAFAVLTGMISGIYPAFRAAKLNPIESLAYDA